MVHVNPALAIALVAALLVLAIALAYVRRRMAGGGLRMDIGGATPRAAGGSDASPETSFHNRINGVRAFVASILAVLLARIYGMQLIATDEYASQAESNRTRTVTTSAPRGRILDRNEVELVSNRASLTVAAKVEVLDDEVEMQLLANLIGMPYLAVRRKIQNTNEGAQSMRTVASDVSRRVVAYIGEHPYLFGGVEVQERTERLYPNGSLAAHVLGYTGTISQEQLEWSEDPRNDSGMTYEAGDVVGQAGVEYQYESVLQGIRGEQVVYVDAYGTVLDQTTSIDPQSGSDVVLTLDATIQRAAEESLTRVITSIRDSGNKECNAGAAVAIDVTNGEIIALASAPSYNPSVFTGGISHDDWERLSSEDAASPLLNRVVSGQYPSASTIKPFGVMAAIDSGIADEGSGFYCTGYWTGFGEEYGQYCYNHDGHGAMNLETGITYSCDVVFYEIGKGFYLSDSPEGLQETYRRWGLGSLTGIDLPSEEAGRVPDAEWKWNYWDTSPDDAREWQGGDSTNLSIGQGDILVTPLQMACAYAGIATRGTIWRPHVLKGVRSSTGSGTVIKHSPEIERSVTEKPSTYDLVYRGLDGVIYVESAAQAEHFTNMRERVAGKTGTAERPNVTQPTGWFVAFVPSDDPKYAIASVIEQGGYGSNSAMYVVRDIMGAIYNEPDTSNAVDQTGA